MQETTLVIGAGVIGTGVALDLARAGHRVTVLDQASAPGHGSTGASSAIVRYHYRHRDEAVVAWEAGLRWKSWERYLGARDPTGMARFRPTGLLVLPGRELDMAEALEHMQALGIAVEPLAAAQLRARFPALDPAVLGPPTLPAAPQFWLEKHGVGPAYWIPESGYVDDPQLAAHNLMHAAQQHGAVFRFSSTVTEVTRSAGHVTGVVLEGGEVIEAAVVVNVAGPWSRAINEMA